MGVRNIHVGDRVKVAFGFEHRLNGTIGTVFLVNPWSIEIIFDNPGDQQLAGHRWFKRSQLTRVKEEII